MIARLRAIFGSTALAEPELVPEPPLVSVEPEPIIAVPAYLAGPMSGIDQNNYPAFALAAERLRARGINLTSPHEVIPLSEAHLWTWAQCLRADIGRLLLCEAIILIDGWERSRGACLERLIAAALGMDVYTYDGAADRLVSLSGEHA